MLNDSDKQIILDNANSGSNFSNILKKLGRCINHRNISEVKNYLISIGFDCNKISNNKRSKMFDISKEDYQSLFDNSNTLSEILIKIGFTPKGNNNSTLHRVIEFYELDLSKFRINNVNYMKENSFNKSYMNISYEELISKSNSRNTIKRYIIKNKLIDYVCADCGNNGFHNNKELSLQLDHINGINDDNRLLNLRFLCPNCHSQTDTFASKSRKNKKIDPIENVEVTSHMKERKKKFEVSKLELEQLLSELPMTKIGEKFGVSDNAIRKRCINLGIEVKSKIIR